MSVNIENEISKFFKTDKHYLYEFFILKSLLDVVDYTTEPSKGRWNGVTKSKDEFIIDLDFIASSLGFFYWRPTFYFQLIKKSSNPIDYIICKILNDFVQNYKKNRGIIKPKNTFLCSKTTKDYREKIKNIIKKNQTLKSLDSFSFFNISNDYIMHIPINSFNQIKQNKQCLNDKLDIVYGNYVKTINPILSKITIEQPKHPKGLLTKTFEKIKETQNHCFYCDDKNFNIQEHVIPAQIMGETIESNIVGSCEKCNRQKLDFLLPRKEFDKVLQRNDEHCDIMEDDYDSSTFDEKYKALVKLGYPIWIR